MPRKLKKTQAAKAAEHKLPSEKAGREEAGSVQSPGKPGRFYPLPEQGLTSGQAAELARNGCSNNTTDPNIKTTGQIIRENTLTFFNLVFVVLAILLVTARSFTNMAFMLIAILNTLIGIIQQLRSRNTLAKLSLLAESSVDVVRDGQIVRLQLRELVREDIVELHAGDQIPGDGPVLSGSAQVNEALLTGEADTITKNVGDSLLSGSFVVAGHCRVRLDHVGEESYACQLSQKAKADTGTGGSQMMRSLDRLIRVIGFALIPIGIALFWNEYYVQNNTWTVAIPSVVAALIGMIPEGLYLLTSVALALSAQRLAERRVLVHDLNSIETLARVDVLCVDKTGTITCPDMEVREVVFLDEAQYPKERVDSIFNACYTVLDADNDTAKAMAAHFNQKLYWSVDRIIPFTSATKWSAVTFRDEGSYVIGAPEFILGDAYTLLEPLAAPYQAEGCRLLLAAECAVPPEQGHLYGELYPLALVVIENPVRPEAPETFRYFAENNVAIRVISGDNPATVSQIAGQAGIAGAENYVDTSTLHTAEDYDAAVQQYTVFGRVTPEQKCELVNALHRAGHTVAMTGDGVNDVLALKDADCGIAMASGAEAACQVAQLVLLDSDFSAMPQVVQEGRRVINNIQRSASLYLTKNIMSLFLSLITFFAGFPYPFVPIQLSLIGALTIGFPSFVLALEPNHELVHGKFMQNVLRRALPGGLTNIVLIVGLELFTMAFTFERATLSTMATVLMGFVGILVLYYISRPLDWKRWLLLGSMSAALIITLLCFGDLFQISALDFQSGLVISVFLMLAPSVIWFFERIFVLGSRAMNWIAEFRAVRTEIRARHSSDSDADTL